MSSCVDSGLQMFIILATSVDKCRFSHFTLYVMNGSLIHMYSESYLRLNLGQHWIYNHLLIVAHINNSILIEEFLHKFGFVDLNKQCFQDPEIYLKSHGVVQSSHQALQWCMLTKIMHFLNFQRIMPPLLLVIYIKKPHYMLLHITLESLFST